MARRETLGNETRLKIREGDPGITTASDVRGLVSRPISDNDLGDKVIDESAELCSFASQTDEACRYKSNDALEEYAFARDSTAIDAILGTMSAIVAEEIDTAEIIDELFSPNKSTPSQGTNNAENRNIVDDKPSIKRRRQNLANKQSYSNLTGLTTVTETRDLVAR